MVKGEDDREVLVMGLLPTVDVDDDGDVISFVESRLSRICLARSRSRCASLTGSSVSSLSFVEEEVSCSRVGVVLLLALGAIVINPNASQGRIRRTMLNDRNNNNAKPDDDTSKQRRDNMSLLRWSSKSNF